MSQDPLLGMDAMIADAIGYAIPVNSKMGKLIRESGVVRSSEFRRIAALPRRDWEKDPQLEELRILLTQHLRRPGGTMELKPNQAAALRDIVDHGGLFGPQAVGVGKTLITLLAPVVLKAQRPLLFVPASVRDQTLRKVLPQMRKHWRLHPMLRVESYTAVSLEKNAKMLDTYQPDLILADECHNLSGATSGRTKRIRRYMNAHPETKFLAVSGTVTNRSILAYAEILYWCLKNASPLPTNWRELQDWARALDEDVPDDKRMPPGALALFCEQGETVRHGFRRRLSETPGIVATRDGEFGTSLRIHRREINAPPHIHAMIAKLRRDWETPNGDAIVEAVEVWRHARELALGMWYRWDPPPPRDWFDARRAWNQHVREVLKHNKRGLDTPLQVWMECAQNPVPLKAFTDWRDVKDTFEPNTVAVWESEYLLQDAARWLRDTENGGGIAWVEHIVFGERLAQVAGVPYFGGGEKASHDILDATGPCVASIAAHSTGKNLVQWSRNLVTCPPTSGKMWEQMLGRTHRQGQTADEVEAWVYQHTDEFRAALAQAVRDARYLKETLGGAQRLLYCDTTFDIDETIDETRWYDPVMWKKIPGVRGYEASVDGRVRSFHRGSPKELKQGSHRLGYRVVWLYYGSQRRTCFVHRLVLAAFRGWDREREAAHLDGSRNNNRLSNLVWATREENMRHRILHGTLPDLRGENHPQHKLTIRDVRRMRSLRAQGVSQKRLAHRFGVTQSTISSICRRDTWAHVK